MRRLKTRRYVLYAILSGGIFFFLIAVRAGIIPGFSKNRILSAPAGSVLSEKDTWMNILQKGQKIGYAHLRIKKEGHFLRLLESLFMRIRIMGTASNVEMHTKATLTADYRIVTFDFSIRSGLFAFSASGRFKPEKGFEITTRIAGRTEKQIIPAEKPPYLPAALPYAAFSMRRPVAGSIYEFPIFDPSTMQNITAEMEVAGKERIEVAGKPVYATKIVIRTMGIEQFAWLDENNEVVRQSGLLGIVMEKTTAADAVSGISTLGGPDFIRLSAIPVNRPIHAKEKLTRLVLKLSGTDFTGFDLDGGRQSFSGGRVAVTKEVMKFSTTGFSELRTNDTIAFLKPAPFIESDHEEIVSLAKELSRPEDTPVVRARRIISWIYKNIEKRPVISIPDALATLKNKMGDCNEHAVLLAAVARAAGIPADIEAGIVYMNGKFYYHAWNRLFLGKWVTADAALGQFPADVTHVRFIRGSLDQQAKLLRLMDRLNITLVSTTPRVKVIRKVK